MGAATRPRGCACGARDGAWGMAQLSEVELPKGEGHVDFESGEAHYRVVCHQQFAWGLYLIAYGKQRPILDITKKSDTYLLVSNGDEILGTFSDWRTGIEENL